MEEAFVDECPSKFNFPKFHDMEHAGQSIAEYGSLRNTSANAGERAHKVNTKRPYAQTNKKDCEVQMAAGIYREEVIADIISDWPELSEQLKEINKGLEGEHLGHTGEASYKKKRKRFENQNDMASEQHQKATCLVGEVRGGSKRQGSNFVVLGQQTRNSEMCGFFKVSFH